jgi:serine protease Do
MSHQDVGPRLLGVIGLVTLFAACSPQSSTAAATSAAPAAAGATRMAAATPTAGPGGAATPTPSAIAAANRGLPDFASLVEQVGPAVVNVTVTEKAAPVQSFSFGGQGGDDSDDPLNEFFRRFGIPRGGAPMPRDNVPAQGVGSGFIVSSDGYILTNAHVVNNASKIKVRLTDRREFDAKVIGSDERTDVAVIKINAKGSLPTVRIGDSDKLRPGEWVLAIGSPFRFENSVTAGVVSGIGRELGDSNYVPFIQTDVAVNPGNSGGPLFNLNGEVIGINSQIFSSTGAYQGISFAIPINVASEVREQLIKSGHVTRGRIGVSVQPVTALLAENFGLDRPRGAVVASVESGSPAERAGIEAQDIILSVNGKVVETEDQLPSLISAIRPGQTAQLDVWRDRGVKHISVVVEELKEKKTAQVSARGGADQGGGEPTTVNRIGLSVRMLSTAEKSQMQTRGNLVVVGSMGSAAEAGIREGDVILAINRTRPDSVGQFQAAVKAAGRSATLLIQRDSVQSIVTVELE